MSEHHFLNYIFLKELNEDKFAILSDDSDELESTVPDGFSEWWLVASDAIPDVPIWAKSGCHHSTQGARFLQHTHRF